MGNMIVNKRIEDSIFGDDKTDNEVKKVKKEHRMLPQHMYGVRYLKNLLKYLQDLTVLFSIIGTQGCGRSKFSRPK